MNIIPRISDKSIEIRRVFPVLRPPPLQGKLTWQLPVAACWTPFCGWGSQGLRVRLQPATNC